MRGIGGRRSLRLCWLVSIGVAATLRAAAAAALQGGVPTGEWIWESVDELPPPAELIPGSGAHLTAGTLDMRPASADESTTGRFLLAFELRDANGATTPSTVQGRFIAFADSLHFIPDGSTPAAPVRFHYAWLPRGRVALTDPAGRVWVYVRRS